MEQQPGGESIFLQITEVFHCEDVDENFVFVRISNEMCDIVKMLMKNFVIVIILIKCLSL